MINESKSLHKLLIIIAMMTCFSMIFLNESGAIGVAFPQMQQALNLSNNAVQWIMNGFLLTAAMLLLLGGKLADHYGRRKIFIIGLILFAIASAICGVAENGWVMIIGRVLQAIGASLVYPSGGALISHSFPENEFAKAYGTVMGVAYLFVAFGPFVGGLFTDFLNWRWLFWINIIFSAICLALVLTAIPKDVITDKPPRLDIKGLIILIIGLGALVFALMQGPVLGWDSAWIISLFVIAVIGLIVFVLVELKTAEPLLQVRMFRNTGFMAGNIIFPCVAACFTALVFWAIWLQQTFNFSPVMAGVSMIPATVISLFMLRIAGAWGGKVGPRKPMLLGACLLVLGVFWIAISANAQSYPWLFVGFLLFGFATPLIIPNSIGTIMNAVAPNQRGVASGVYLTLQHVAFSLGFAVLAAVISTNDDKQLTRLLNSTPDYAGITPHQVHVLLAGKNIIPQLSADKLAVLKQAAVLNYTHAFSWGMAAIGIFAIIVLIFTIVFIPKRQTVLDT
jgi:EmrB/QacA subfamily drug resistance transporter